MPNKSTAYVPIQVSLMWTIVIGYCTYNGWYEN